MVTLCPGHGPDPDASQAAPFDHLVTSPRSKPAHSGSGPIRTFTATSPQPGPDPRHLSGSDAPDPAPWSPLATHSTALRSSEASTLHLWNVPDWRRAGTAICTDPLHGRHNYLPARRTPERPDPESACEWPTTSSARCLHTAQHQRYLHVNGTQQPPSCRPAGGLVGFEPHGSVSDAQPSACVIRCPNKLPLPDTHQKAQGGLSLQESSAQSKRAL
jgi:hypothetical protein